MTAPAFVAFVNGVYGVGKTTVLDHMADALAAARRPFSLFDVDWFHRSWPPADHDPDNVLIEADNLRAVWQNYRRAGGRQPIVGGVLETAADTSRYARVFDLPVRAVLLIASPEAVRERLEADMAAAARQPWRGTSIATRRRPAGSWREVSSSRRSTPTACSQGRLPCACSPASPSLVERCPSGSHRACEQRREDRAAAWTAHRRSAYRVA